MATETTDKVRTILAEYKEVDPSEISAESSFEALELDSLDVVEIVMLLEDEFGVSLEMSPDLKKVSDVVALIEAKQQ
jgi:acyl carrier protein